MRMLLVHFSLSSSFLVCVWVCECSIVSLLTSLFNVSVFNCLFYCQLAPGMSCVNVCLCLCCACSVRFCLCLFYRTKKGRFINIERGWDCAQLLLRTVRGWNRFHSWILWVRLWACAGISAAKVHFSSSRHPLLCSFLLHGHSNSCPLDMTLDMREWGIRHTHRSLFFRSIRTKNSEKKCAAMRMRKREEEEGRRERGKWMFHRSDGQRERGVKELEKAVAVSLDEFTGDWSSWAVAHEETFCSDQLDYHELLQLRLKLARVPWEIKHQASRMEDGGWSINKQTAFSFEWEKCDN